MYCVNDLCCTLIIPVFSFLIFIHFTKQIALKQSLAQKLNLIFKYDEEADNYSTLDTHGP